MRGRTGANHDPRTSVRLMFLPFALISWVLASLPAAVPAPIWNQVTVGTQVVAHHSLWHPRNQPLIPARAEFDHGHTSWTRLLTRFSSDGQVDYSAWHESGQRELDAYLASLSSVTRSEYAGWSTSQQLAFWINGYNAFTIRLILDNHPISSIRSIGFLPGAAFRSAFIPMGKLRGGKLSLNDIEHEILRKEFNEPRIHFAIVCASTSCPKLSEEAYVASKLEEQLESAASGFIHDPSRNRYERSSNTLYLSAIFDWFGEDFIRDAGSVEQYVSRYMDDPDAPTIRQGKTKVSFLSYDWSLNGK